MLAAWNSPILSIFESCMRPLCEEPFVFAECGVKRTESSIDD